MPATAQRQATLQQQFQTAREVCTRHDLDHTGIDALVSLARLKHSRAYSTCFYL